MVSDELAEAEWKLREFSGGNWIGDYFAENEAAGVVLKELDRLRAVEKAAAELVEHLITEIPPDEDHRVGAQWNSKRNRLEFALVDAVRGETP